MSDAGLILDIEQCLEHVLSATRTVFDVIDEEFNIRHVNPGSQKTLGDPSGRKCHEYFMGLGHPCPACALPKAFATKQPQVSEAVLAKEGGRIVEVHTIPFQDPSGRWLVSELKVDITERKRAKEALAESEKKYKTLFDQASDGIMLMSTDGETLFWNRSFARMHGYDSPEQMRHLRLQDLDSPETAKLTQERLRRLLAGESMSFEVEHRHKDGHTFPLSVSCNVVQFEGKRYFLGFHRDITERKKAEQATRQKDILFKQFFDNLTVGVAVWEVDAGGRIRLADINPTGLDLSRVVREDVVGKFAQDAFPGMEKFGLLHVIRRVHDSGQPESYPTTYYEDQRIKAWYENLVFRIPSGQVAAVYQDVTERRKAEESLARLNACFLGLGPDPKSNIDSLIELFGTLSAASFVMYNRLEGDQLVAAGGWRLPKGVPRSGPGKGNICFDLIRRRHGGPILIKDLSKTKYARTAPGVLRLGLRTYLGHSIKRGDAFIGMLCALYREDVAPSQDIFKLMQIVAAAIGTEESRLQALEEVSQSERMLKEQRKVLEQKNAALSELLSHIEREKTLLGRSVSEQVDKRILPLLARLPMDEQARGVVKTLRQHLKDLAAPMQKGAAYELSKLSPRELEICDMIKSGLSSKEIAQSLNTSPQTVDKQRKNIRRKLKLKGKDANLTVFLQRHR